MTPTLVVGVSPYAVHPPSHGGKARVDGILGHLGAGWRVEHFAQVPHRADLPLPRARVVVDSRRVEYRFRDPLSIAWMELSGRRGWPPLHLDTMLGLLPRRPLRDALAHADAVIVFHPYQMRWVRRATPPRVPLILDAANIEHELYGDNAGPVGRRLVARLQAVEVEAWRQATAIFATSDDDAESIRAHAAAEVVVVPNGVDVERILPASAAERHRLRADNELPVDGLIAVFVGSAHRPNLDAVARLEADAARYAAAGITIVVVGRAGLGRPRIANIVTTGQVVDTAPYLRAADIALCPLQSGSGTSLKSVEYLAAGLPVLSTEVGVRGLGLRDGDTAVICRLEEMPVHAARLAADPGLRAAIGERARRCAEERFSWTAVGQRATAALDRLASCA